MNWILEKKHQNCSIYNRVQKKSEARETTKLSSNFGNDNTNTVVVLS
jgi:hypothetical protein